MPQPEQQAREKIDQLLHAAGWHVCDAAAASIHTVCSKQIFGFFHRVEKQERKVRKTCWEELGDDFAYDLNQLDRDVVTPDLMTIELPVPTLTAQRTFDTPQTKVATMNAYYTTIRQANDELILATLERVFAGAD